MKYKKKWRKFYIDIPLHFQNRGMYVVPPSFNRDWKSVNVENGGFNDIGYMRALRV